MRVNTHSKCFMFYWTLHAVCSTEVSYEAYFIWDIFIPLTHTWGQRIIPSQLFHCRDGTHCHLNQQLPGLASPASGAEWKEDGIHSVVTADSTSYHDGGNNAGLGRSLCNLLCITGSPQVEFWRTLEGSSVSCPGICQPGWTVIIAHVSLWKLLGVWH